LSLGSSESHKTQPKPQQTVSNNPPSFSSSSNSSKPNTSSNVDLLLDLGIDDFPKSQGQSSTNQGQVRGFDSDFDLLSGTTDNVQPAGGVSDPWGEFTSARYNCHGFIVNQTCMAVEDIDLSQLMGRSFLKMLFEGNDSV
jgi:hypothetical protein